ncbi:MAG: hypothetical protein GX678_07645 [Actinomycetales bacterium]|nr:hypothetical protein [Actinomycetales bacterium]
MNPLIKSIAIALLANAASLALAVLVFSGFTTSIVWYVIAVIVFTMLNVALREIAAIATPSLIRVSTIAGGLVLTFAALALTNVIVPDVHFNIEGWGTWLGVTFIVWAAGVAYGEVDTKAPANVPGASV